MKELVSVIIPTFNRRNSIWKSVDSVLQQSYKNIEVIVVDDASQDGTYELFQDCIDKRVRYFRYEVNHGACYARNFGIEQAKGDYIAFQDSDDIWMREKLKKQFDYLLNSKADFVFCGMYRESKGRKSYEPRYNFKDNEDIVSQQLFRNGISTQTMFMKKSVCNKVHFDESFARFQDWDFALQVALNGFKIVYLPEALVESKASQDSISNNIKAPLALEHLYGKYEKEYMKYPHSRAQFYCFLAQSYRNTDKKKARNLLLQSLKIEFDFKALSRLIINEFGLWGNVKLEKFYTKITKHS